MQTTSEKKQSLKLNRQITTFLVCVFISTILWLFISLSVNNHSLLDVPVSYEGFEDAKTLVNKLPQNFKLKVTTSEFKILMRKYLFYTDTIIIQSNRTSMEYNGNRAFILTREIQSEIEDQLKPQMKVLSIMPDTIHFYFDNRVSKKVPVILISSLSYEKQCQLADSLKPVPDSVVITGSEKLLKNVSAIKTSVLKLENLKESTIKYVMLDKASLVDSSQLINYDTSRIGISTSTVKVDIPIERYTESVVEVTVNVSGFPSGQTVILSPSKVKVKYQVSYTDYDKVKPEMFKIQLEYPQSKLTGQGDVRTARSGKGTVRLVKRPDFVKVSRIEPEKIEYILRHGQ